MALREMLIRELDASLLLRLLDDFLAAMSIRRWDGVSWRRAQDRDLRENMWMEDGLEFDRWSGQVEEVPWGEIGVCRILCVSQF